MNRTFIFDDDVFGGCTVKIAVTGEHSLHSILHECVMRLHSILHQLNMTKLLIRLKSVQFYIADVMDITEIFNSDGTQEYYIRDQKPEI